LTLAPAPPTLPPMDSETTRSLDACAPLMLTPLDHGTSEVSCGHGVWAETRFDAPTGTVTLLLREAERHDGSVRVAGDRVTARASLSTGRCTPTDERAARFLADHPWIEEALTQQLDLLQDRAHRAEAQRDRTTCRKALATAGLDAMVSYDELYPADWDLLLTHAGMTYWAVDQHCPRPRCPCTEVSVIFYRIDDDGTRCVGKANRELRYPNAQVKGSSSLTTQLFTKLWEKSREELVRRHQEVRAEVQAKQANPALTATGISRNAPCPCGSGKKYKRCCADRDRARST
jgi:hypothetical protein